MGKIRAPRGSNALDSTSGGEAGLGRETQAIPTQATGRMGPVSTKNRHSRPISGPKASRVNELDYRGT